MTRRRCRGAAVVTALLVTSLAVLLVSGAVVRQAVVVRQVENAAERSQARWLLAGAVDWVRIILREDGRTTVIDHIGEPWATPLARTRLDNGTRDPGWLSGRVEDMQGRFNLRGLLEPASPPAAELAALQRLLDFVGISGANAIGLTARLRASASVRRPEGAWIQAASLEDIAWTEAADRAAWTRLRPFVVLLPMVSPLNVNTASAEVLAARIPALSLADARALVASRDRALFRNLEDFKQRLGGAALDTVPSDTGVASRLFLLTGQVEYGRARLSARVLLQRSADRVEVLWMRDDMAVPAPVSGSVAG